MCNLSFASFSHCILLCYWTEAGASGHGVRAVVQAGVLVGEGHAGIIHGGGCARGGAWRAADK